MTRKETTPEEQKRFEKACRECYEEDCRIEEETEDPMPIADYSQPGTRELAAALGVDGEGEVADRSEELLRETGIDAGGGCVESWEFVD